MTRAVDSISSRSVRHFALMVGVALLTACLWHLRLRWDEVPFPRNTFLFTSADRFNDWHNSVAATLGGNPYFSRTRAIPTYFPFTYVVLTAFSRLPRVASTVAYLAISLGLLTWAILLCQRCWSPPRPRSASAGRPGSPLLTLVCAVSYPVVFVLDPENLDLWIGLTLAIVLCHWCWASSRRHPHEASRDERSLLLLACVLTYPIIFALDRGNLDVWIAALCLVHVVSLGTRRQRTGLVCLAVAIALKGYPIIFLALGLSQRKWGAAMGCAAMAALLTLGPLLFLWDGLAYNLSGFLLNLQRFHRAYVAGPHSLFASSDPYNGLRVLALLASPWPNGTVLGYPVTDINAWSSAILRVYSLASLTFVLACLSFVLAVPAARWRRITAVCLAAILFPNVANDYKLTILLPGLLALLFDPQPMWRGRVAIVLFALLMVPKAYVWIDGRSLSNLLNPCLLIALALCVLVDGRAWRRGLRLLRFRILWLAATLPGGAGWARRLAFGKPVNFLLRTHRSMVLDVI